MNFKSENSTQDLDLDGDKSEHLIKKVIKDRHSVNFVNYQANNEDDEITQMHDIHFLQFSPLKAYLLMPILSVITLFILPICVYWYTSLKVKYLYYENVSLDQATHVLIKGNVQGEYGDTTIEDMYCSNLQNKIDAFEYRFVQFVYNFAKDQFEPTLYPVSMPHKKILSTLIGGLKSQDIADRRKLYGQCQLEVPKPSIMNLMIEEILNPFYLFQVFSVILWFWDEYTNYAICIMVISFWGIAESLYETISNNNMVRKLATYHCDVEVLRDGQLKKVVSDELVPGDVIKVPNNQVLPCDLVLMQGCCIVNESMLTGESVPVMKNCIQSIDQQYDPQDDKSKKVTLFSGTNVIQARSRGGQPVYAVVIRTGFVTLKGTLVRDILFPKPTKFTFYKDSMIWVACMAMVGVFGYAILVPKLISQDLETAQIVDKSLDLITVCVPPALPATMTIGITFAMSRLKKK